MQEYPLLLLMMGREPQYRVREHEVGGAAGEILCRLGGQYMTGTGKIHIYYGNGKGKTTAAVGQIVRAAGSGLRVLVFQFLKDNSSSERVILEQIPNITCLNGREKVKFFNQMNGEEKAELKHYNTKALDEIVKFCSPFDVLFLDEILCAVQLGLLNEDKLLRFLEQKPRGLEIIMTGHDVSERMMGIADYVTEMMKIKHPYDQGVSAREGIEY